MKQSDRSSAGAFRRWAIALWIGLVLAGFAVAARYQAAPGKAAHAPNRIDASTGAQLIVFLHPACPCSRATVVELSRLLVERPDWLEVKAYVLAPTVRPEAWTDRLTPELSQLDGVQVVEDPDGRKARQFGARTSGQVLLYSEKGQLLMSGGITPSRGHEGSSAGGETIRQYMRGRAVEAIRTPVFGCALFSE